MEDEILYREESYQVVAAAIQVWKTLGFGFLEKVYENALAIELRKAGKPRKDTKNTKVWLT